jgi:peroxiredoxin
MKKYFLLIWIFFIPLFLFSQKTSITGQATSAENQVIRVLAFDDFISEKIITLGESNISDDGSFFIEFELKDTIHTYLDINYQRSDIFLEPGKSYSIEVKYSPANQLESYYDRQGLVYDFRDADPEDLNQLIWRFNEMYNKFIIENFSHIVNLRDKSRVTKFREEVKAEFHSVEHSYFINYVKYKMADVEQFARLKGKIVLANEYLDNQAVLYNNVEYTFFFSQFFEKFLITSPDVITVPDLIIAVNHKQDYRIIMDSLSSLPYLQDENFRELVLLFSLKGLYHNGTFKKGSVLEMLKDIRLNTRDPEHRKIAANLLEKFAKLMPGLQAPDLELADEEAAMFRLSDIKGKPILLTFFRSKQPGLTAEFDLLVELYNVYKSGLEIISVSMDPSAADMQSIIRSGKYPWKFAHYQNDPEVYDLYNIRHLPLYVLIDVEGNIAVCPAPSPEDELENAIMKVIH